VLYLLLIFLAIYIVETVVTAAVRRELWRWEVNRAQA
jgi:hypothetical protein